MNEEVKLLQAMPGSARANGGEVFGRITFRLSGSPEQRWRALFDACKGPGVSVEERGTAFLLHAEVKPGEVVAKRDALVALLTDVNDQRRSELARQFEQARERTENKQHIEDSLNRELEALKFE